MAVQDPQDQQQPPTHPQVQRLIDAAQVGAVVKASGAAVTAPSFAVTLPATAAKEILSVPAEALAHGVKIALILRILRALFRRRRIESVGALEKELRKRFPDLDDATLRRIIQQEAVYEDAFQRKATRRVEADLHAAGQLPTKEKQSERVKQIVNREKHYGVLRERAMWARAIQRGHNETVRLQSPLGAKWVLGAAKEHTLGCLALAGKNWPWAVLDTIPPPLHTNCQCSLQPLGPNDTVPPTGEAMAMARRAIALEEAIHAVADPGEIDACLTGLPVRPSIERALIELLETDYREGLHPRGRGGRWITKLGKKRIELKGDKKLQERSAHAVVRKVAEGLVDFYGGDKAAVGARYEPDYMRDVGGVARFHHPDELVAGISYGQNVMDDIRDPEMGVHNLRIVAHEAAHSLSGNRPGPLPGFAQTFEEGGAEILSLWFWHHRAQPFDHRDAVRVRSGDGPTRWAEPGTEALAHSVVYRPYVEELMRRAASKVGWDRTAIVDEVERVMRGDHYVRMHFRDETNEHFPLPADLPETSKGAFRDDEHDHAVALIHWLLADDKPGAPAAFDTGELKTDKAKAAAAEAEHAIQKATGGLVPMRLTQLPDHDAATARSLPPGGVIAVHEDSGPQFQVSAIVHEYAHGIDRARNNDDWFTQTADFKPLYDALMASPTVQKLRADEVELMKGDDRGRAQMLQGRELFARAFEQYVADHSDNEVLRERLRKLQADQMLGFQQWQDDEFKPISVEMEKALAKIYAELAARPIQEATYTEGLHPRTRLGRFMEKLGDRLEYREHHHAEASNVGGKIIVGRKFLDLPEAHQDYVIAHELGHDIDDALLADPKTAWVWKDESWADAHGDVLGGPQQTPGERIADAYAVAYTGEVGDAKRWPAILHVAAEAKQRGLPIHPKIEAMLKDRPPVPAGPVREQRHIGVGRKATAAFTADDAAALPDDKVAAYKAILDHPGLSWSKDADTHREGDTLVVGGAFLDASPAQRREITAKLQESVFTEWLHPRGRSGRWVEAIAHAEPVHEPSRHEGFTGEDFASALDGFEHGGIVAVRANRTETQHLYADVWLNLQRPGGAAPVGLARVVLKPPNNQGRRGAEIENVYLKESEQNQGFGRAFTDHLFSTLRDGGVDDIALEAISVGGYSWARRGFVWTGDKTAVQREILQAAKDDGRWSRVQGHLPEDRYAELERKLLAGEFSSEAELAAYGINEPWWIEHEEPRRQDEDYVAPERERTWLGKELLIGSRWKGSRPVVVSEALTEEVYVEGLHPRGRGGEWIAKFSHALKQLPKPSRFGREGGVLETGGHEVRRTRHGYEVTPRGGGVKSYQTAEDAAEDVHVRREAERLQAEAEAEAATRHEHEQRRAAARDEANAKQAARTWYRFESAESAQRIKDTGEIWGLPGYQGRGMVPKVRSQPHRPEEATIARERANGRVLVEFHTKVAPDSEVGKPHFSWTPGSPAQAHNEKHSGVQGLRSEPEETQYGRKDVAKLGVHDVRIIS